METTAEKRAIIAKIRTERAAKRREVLNRLGATVVRRTPRGVESDSLRNERVTTLSSLEAKLDRLDHRLLALNSLIVRVRQFT